MVTQGCGTPRSFPRFSLILTGGYFDGVEEEKEDELEELLVGLPEGTNPRCAMVGVPPGISSETAGTSEVRARDSESFVS